MSHIVKTYAKSLDVKVGRPILKEHYYPLPSDNYVLIHTSNKVPAKNYTYWPDTVRILKKEFAKHNIDLIQIGAKEDEKIDGIDNFINWTTFKQSFYLIKHCKMLVGIDSVPGHIASAYNRPTVTLFAHTYSETAKPIWSGNRAVVIESDRDGNKPSFSYNEDPKSIDRIKPEQIAQAVFEQLQLTQTYNEETIYIGKKYCSKIIDIIPQERVSEINYIDSEVRVRMDLIHNENILLDCLQKAQHKLSIVCNQPVNESLINSFKHKIEKIIYTCESFDERFMKFLKHSGVPFELNCNSEKNISKERLKFFNYDIVYENVVEEAKKLKKELFEKFEENLKFYSGRFYILGDTTLPTIGKNPDDINFWIDIPYFRVYSVE